MAGGAWLDGNGDGTRQATELAGENVPVYLFTSTGDYYDSTLTDADGKYEFVNLDPGDYYVEFGRLSAKTWTSKDQGGDDTADSDADAVNGQTAVFTVDYGVDVSALDVGLVDNTNNHAPQGTDATIALWEDFGHTLSTADFGFTDPNDTAANEFASIIITSLPAAGTLELAGATVVIGQEITIAEIENGDLVYLSPADQFGTSFAAFSFQVKDDGGALGTGSDTDATANTITFDVLSSNDAPVGADKTITITSDNPVPLSISDFGFADPNDSTPNGLQSIFVVSLPASGVLTLNTVPIVAGAEITAAQLALGDFAFLPTAGAFGSPLASFEFGLMDDGGVDDGDGSPYSAATYLITFERNDTNGEAPVNQLPAAQTVNENGTLVFSTANGNAITVAAPHVGTADVEITLTVTNGTLSVGSFVGVTHTAGDGVDDAAMTFHGNLTDLNAALEGLAFAPTVDYFGGATLQILSNDLGNGGFGGDRTQNNLLGITVISVNNAPTGWDISRPVGEDAVYTFIVPDFGFEDTDGNEFQAVRVESLPGAGVLANNNNAVQVGDVISLADIIAGNFKFTPTPNENGSNYADWLFKVQDDGGTADGGIDWDLIARTMAFDVWAVNDAPTGVDATVTTLEDTDHIFTAADFVLTDTLDSPADELAGVFISTIPTAGTLTKITGTGPVAVSAGDFISVADIIAGLLVYTPPANANGAALDSFTFQVQDDGGTANGGVDLDPTPRTMTIDVTPVNDAPTAADNTISMAQDTTHTFSMANFGFADLVDLPANYFLDLIITSLPTVGTLLINGNAVTLNQVIPAYAIAYLTYTPPAGQSGIPFDSFKFKVRDNGGTANGGIDTSIAEYTITFWVV